MKIMIGVEWIGDNLDWIQIFYFEALRQGWETSSSGVSVVGIPESFLKLEEHWIQDLSIEIL